MNFFLSSETDGRYDDFSDSLCIIRNDIEEKIKKTIKDKKYSREIDDIGIIFIIIKFDHEMESQGWFKERKLIKRKTKEADIRLRIDYEKFVQSNDETRKLLIINNIVESIKIISERVKDFQGDKLSKDILEIFNLTKEDFTKI